MDLCCTFIAVLFLLKDIGAASNMKIKLKIE